MGGFSGLRLRCDAAYPLFAPTVSLADTNHILGRKVCLRHKPTKNHPKAKVGVEASKVNMDAFPPFPTRSASPNFFRLSTLGEKLVC